MSELRSAATFLERYVGDLEPGVFDAAGAAALVECFARVERLAAAGKALAARRVEECGTWRAAGFRSGAHWLAAKSGSTVGDAEGALGTVRALERLPATAAAFRSGDLSGVQAREIAACAVDDPSVEHDVLATAGGSSVKVLRDACPRGPSHARGRRGMGGAPTSRAAPRSVARSGWHRPRRLEALARGCGAGERRDRRRSRPDLPRSSP